MDKLHFGKCEKSYSNEHAFIKGKIENSLICVSCKKHFYEVKI